jgi:hypothetical protein
MVFPWAHPLDLFQAFAVFIPSKKALEVEVRPVRPVHARLLNECLMGDLYDVF